MKRLLKAFYHAFNGIGHFIRTERNAQIHLISILVVLCMSWYYQLRVNEYIAVIIVIGLVIVSEMMNTAIELLADTLHPAQASGIKHTKDVAAGMVLFSAIIAAVVGVIVFLPHICGS